MSYQRIKKAEAELTATVGWAVTPVQAHCSGDPTHDDKHKIDPCIPDDGGREYQVTITGDVSGGGDT